MTRGWQSGVASLAVVLGGVACGDAPDAPDAPDARPSPDVGVAPATYVAKVKDLLVGLPPTDAEVAAVTADAGQLAKLIDGWMAMPQYETKMKRFFRLAFQQSQISEADFTDQVVFNINPNASTRPLLVQNLIESFARTAWEIVRQGRPFTETMTTRTFMMTPALMELYGFLDDLQVDDAGKITDDFTAANPGMTITVGASSGPIPITESVDPRSPNFMHWYSPDVAGAGLEGCAVDPIRYPPKAIAMHFILSGALMARETPHTQCLQYNGSARGPQLTPADFTSWKMVTIRPPMDATERVTSFYDLPLLRRTHELVLTIPRVGFFSTPAFFANWRTNTSNQARVTMNQTLIVALGTAVDGIDLTVPKSLAGLSTDHAKDGCVGCHQTLDPTRSILSSTYSWAYHRQTEESFANVKGTFAFHGVERSLSSVYDLADTLATHPLFASAWVQKLCTYASSAPCSKDDPEFLRIASVFERSRFSWTTLVRELFASPLVTNASRTKTQADNGEVIAVRRRDHLCAALDARLGFADVCGLDVAPAQASTNLAKILPGLPSDGYSRGKAAPLLTNAPSLFYSAALENICVALADTLVDPPPPLPAGTYWSSTRPDLAIADFVHVVMGLPPADPRAPLAEAALTDHFNAAEAILSNSATGGSDALKSTFVTACLSPSATAVGL